MQKGFGVGRRFSVDHQLKPWKVDTTSGNVCRNADLRATVTHRLQRVRPFGLGQFARERYNLETTVRQAGRQTGYGCASVRKDDGVIGIVEQKCVDDRVFSVMRCTVKDLIRNVRVLLFFCRNFDAQGVFLEVLSQFRDHWRNGRREHQGAAVFGCFGQNELKVFTEAEVEHFVRFVQNNSACHREVERVAFNMVANTTGGADDDVRTAFESATFVARVHAANS